MLFAVLVVTLGTVGSAQAQRPRAVHTPARFFINGHTTAALGTTVSDGVQTGDLRTNMGLGGGVQLGYVITPRLTAYAGLDLAKQGSDVTGVSGNFGLTHLEAGAHLSFPTRGSKVSPYVGAWVARRKLSTTLVDLVTGQEVRLSVSGLGGGLTGGMQYHLSPKLALDGGLSVGIGKLGHMKANGNQGDIPNIKSTTTTRLQFGANWYP
ncbi:MAG TPA: outer membrane beta-barrel protein [Gemmatimonadales bacterium]|nr:outer membrane beta-barrel protein [Gemmatimonadales bacterium]